MSHPPDSPVPQATVSPPALETESVAPSPEPAPAPHASTKRPGFDRSLLEGPLRPAVWRLAWPTMLHNLMGGLQGIVDHVLVGHYVGYEGNAAIGVSWQIYLVVIVFISSLFTGMSVLVSRAAGANDGERVNHIVYQAFLTALLLSFGVLAPLGYVLSPILLDMVNSTAEVQAHALPYLRIMFVFSWGMLLFFMLGGALRSAGDARTPMRLGIAVTLMNLVLNMILIPGVGPIPALGTMGAAIGTVAATGVAGLYALVCLRRDRWVVGFPKGTDPRPDFDVIRSLFRFGLPAGIQGVVMNVGGVLLLGFVGSLALSAQAQAAYTLGYTQLFSLITWTTIGLMSASATLVGQNLGAGRPERATDSVHTAGRIAIGTAASVGLLFLVIPRTLLAIFGMSDPIAVDLAVTLLRFLSISGVFLAIALTYTGGLQGSGDTRSPLYISIISQVALPIGLCFVLQQMGILEAKHIWMAILLGHFTRCILTVIRFRQGAWRDLVVDYGRTGPRSRPA